jgi:hypothetical protein
MPLGSALWRPTCIYSSGRRGAEENRIQESGMAKAKKSLKKSKKLESTKPLMRSFQ